MVQIFQRAFKRAGIPLKYTQGFHPKPKISFGNPLPVGMESEQELFYVTVLNPADAGMITDSLNAQLPPGLTLTGCELNVAKKKFTTPPFDAYRITIPGGRFDADQLAAYEQSDQWVVTAKKGKGELKKIDLKDMLDDIKQLAHDTLILSIKNKPGQMVRPAAVLSAIFQYSPEEVRSLRMIKLAPTAQSSE